MLPRVWCQVRARSLDGNEAQANAFTIVVLPLRMLMPLLPEAGGSAGSKS